MSATASSLALRIQTPPSPLTTHFLPPAPSADNARPPAQTSPAKIQPQPSCTSKGHSSTNEWRGNVTFSEWMGQCGQWLGRVQVHFMLCVSFVSIFSFVFNSNTQLMTMSNIGVGTQVTRIRQDMSVSHLRVTVRLPMGKLMSNLTREPFV